MKVRCLLSLLLLVLLTSALLADDTPKVALLECSGQLSVSYDRGNPVFSWTPECFVGPDCVLNLELQFNGEPGGKSWYKLTGTQELDPVVSQTVLNGSEAVWLDWHVDLLNAVIDRNDGPTVYKVGENSPWQIVWTHNPGYTDGFGAVWVGGNSSVANGESLYIRFRWAPDGSGLPVTIHQYPTDTGQPIPEPASFLVLSTGLTSVALTVIRRKRS